MLDYEGIRTLAKQIGTPAKDLLALTPNNDPFYVDVAFRRTAAEWFVGLREQIDFGHRFHIRRAHYKIISQSTPILKPDGSNYENTDGDWSFLLQASRDARYLELIDPESVIDNRNPSAIINATFEAENMPTVEVIGGELGEMVLPAKLDLPELMLTDFNAQQRYLVEIWTEKSGQNDILRPLAARYRVNLINFDGECSESGCRDAIRRALDAERPLRILYLSDFDPAGRSMPVAAARKIEFWLQRNHPDLDVTVDPLALLPEQAAHYGLPRTPIKEGERRATKFEARFGLGATEIDALEALHPGELREIVEAGILRHLDPDLKDREHEAEREINRYIADAESTVHHRYQAQVNAVQNDYLQLRRKLMELRESAADLWQQMADDLEAAAPYVDVDDVPEACNESDQLTPLFDAGRDDLTQIDWYRRWQGRAA
jgi:hypothetical protein